MSCLAGCAAKHPSAKGFSVLSCVTKNCPNVEAFAPPALPDCATTACPDKCTCGTTHCAKEIQDCLADGSCAGGESCALACPCGSMSCLAGCAAKHPSAKGFSVLSCVTKNCPNVEASSLPIAAPLGNLAVTFKDCGDASTDAVVKDVVPKTIAPGSTTTITGSGTLKKDIAGGKYTMGMTGPLGVVLVKNCEGDASKANTCNIEAPLIGKVGSLAYQPVTFPI